MTPIEEYRELGKKIGLKNIYFKREDLHKYQSHKGRSLPIMIKHYYKQGDRNFVISSSGNAALSSALYIEEFNKDNDDKINLDVYVGINVNQDKYNKLKEIENRNTETIRVLKKERPVQALFQATEEGSRSLRQSTDDIALIGYRSLAEELSEIKDTRAIFVATSSGTTAQALAEYILENQLLIQIHIVQTSSCHPISDQFENYDGPKEKSIADAIVAQTTERLNILTNLIKKTGGYAWTVNNDEILLAKKITEEMTNISISNNSALSVAGAMRSVYRNWPIDGSVICLICGS